VLDIIFVLHTQRRP